MYCLLHLTEKVKDLGPLWYHSTFFFENLNRSFRHLFHGTQHVQIHIMHAVCVQQALPHLMKCLPIGSSELYEQMAFRHTKSKRNHTPINDEIYLVGKL